jgi:superfamily II DNA or RNA helicase
MELARELARLHPDFRDEVRPRLESVPPIVCPGLRPYQAAAVAAWERSDRKGIIALPTGAGKTRAAIAAIARSGFRTLCLVPTRVLLAQWVKMLSEAGLGPIGEYGDGRRI